MSNLTPSHDRGLCQGGRWDGLKRVTKNLWASGTRQKKKGIFRQSRVNLSKNNFVFFMYFKNDIVLPINECSVFLVNIA